MAHVALNGPRERPGHHWWQVLLGDGRMVVDYHLIRYSDERVGFLSFLTDLFPLPPAPVLSRQAPAEMTEKELNQVYRFRAYLKHRKSIWREIEILGSQTLEDLDLILRSAFSHDWDHLSGFWKLKRKGGTRQYRKVSLGTIYPSFVGAGEESANDVQIATLALAVKDRLLYVYDFGDWIEHIIELKEVVPQQPDVEYPRIVARNKRRNKYCVECKAHGRKTVAEWVCISCSNAEGRDVYLCDQCAQENHEDHYVDEIVY